MTHVYSGFDRGKETGTDIGMNEEVCKHKFTVTISANDLRCLHLPLKAQLKNNSVSITLFSLFPKVNDKQYAALIFVLIFHKNPNKLK